MLLHKEVILKGFLDPKNTARIMQIIQYWQVHHHLTLNKKFFTYLWVYLIIPTRMCKEILSQIYEAHQGAVCTKQFNSLYTG